MNENVKKMLDEAEGVLGVPQGKVRANYADQDSRDLIVALRSKGYSYKQIEEASGYSAHYCSNIVFCAKKRKESK